MSYNARRERALSRRAGRRSGAWVVLVAAVMVAGGCDFDVTNPGPVQDENLNSPDAFEAQVKGVVKALGVAINYTGLHSAAVARELHPTGQTGQFGIEPSNTVGILEDAEQGTPWAAAQQARWLGEAAIVRFQDVLDEGDFNSSAVVAEGYLWTGYANRMLGENMCVAVIDGSGPMSPTEYLDRAEEQFSQAIQIGQTAGRSDVVAAAYGGRASVRVQNGDWSGAVSDAGNVQDGFEWTMPYFDTGDEFQLNRIAWSSMNQPYKAHTTWGTVYETYYADTGDPRVSYEVTEGVGTGALECCGAVPWWPQTKYEKDSPIDLTTSEEMRLIEAEGDLQDGDWQAAMEKINSLRAAAGVDDWNVTNEQEAWTALKRERGIELWLEARRLADLRRWSESGTPGDLDPREVPGPESHLETQDFCFPVSRAERDTNPNIG